MLGANDNFTSTGLTFLRTESLIAEGGGGGGGVAPHAGAHVPPLHGHIPQGGCRGHPLSDAVAARAEPPLRRDGPGGGAGLLRSGAPAGQLPAVPQPAAAGGGGPGACRFFTRHGAGGGLY